VVVEVVEVVEGFATRGAVKILIGYKSSASLRYVLLTLVVDLELLRSRTEFLTERAKVVESAFLEFRLDGSSSYTPIGRCRMGCRR